MKTFKQVIMPIAIVMALVFGVTFLSNYSTTGPREDPTGVELSNNNSAAPSISNEIPLRFGATIAERNAESYYVKHFKTEYEIDQPGAFDFWFQNRNPQPALLRITNLSCQCQSMEAALIPPTLARTFYQQCADAALLTSLAPGAPDLLSLAGLVQLSFSTSELRWAKMSMESDQVEIPPTSSENGPQLGFVRLHWKGKAPAGPKRLTASMQMQLPGANARPFQLEAHTIVLPPIRYYPPQADFGDLSAGGNSTREFYVFSSTRTPAELNLAIRDDKPHPCVVIDKPEIVAPEEARRLENQLREEWKEPIQLSAVYRVKVTAHETFKGQQLDMGPINRNLTISLGPDQEYTIPIKGMVRGEVRLVGEADDRDFINLGQSISSERGRTREVRIVSDRNNLDLELLASETLPKFLEVEFKSLGVIDGKKQWALKVRVPEKRLYGKLLPDSGVTLQSKDSPPRRVRIPIRGQTFDTSGDF